jgi:hypothetical protein
MINQYFLIFHFFFDFRRLLLKLLSGVSGFFLREGARLFGGWGEKKILNPGKSQDPGREFFGPLSKILLSSLEQNHKKR